MIYLTQLGSIRIVQFSSRREAVVGAKGEVHLTLEPITVEEICCNPSKDSKENLQMPVLCTPTL